MKVNGHKLEELESALRGVRTAGIATLPTPLQEVPRFSRALGGPRILIKREDMTGLATGGNKTRKLEYILGEAIDQGADTLVAGGGSAQSNHARQCAAAARALGMDPILVLRKGPENQRKMQGNLLLDHVLGAEMVLVDEDRVQTDSLPRFGLQYLMEEIAEQRRATGRKPYVLATSSVPLGAVAYAAALVELFEQCDRSKVTPNHIFLTSTGSSQAGLALASKHIEAPWRVVGIAVASAVPAQETVSRLANDAAEVLKLSTRLGPGEVFNQEYSGEGYGILSDEALEAIHLLARNEGILLDPVYSGKGMAGLIDNIRTGALSRDDTVVFVHTGGNTAIFAYADEMTGGSSYFESP